ncbi:MAG TPA: hypothetical protein VJ161_10715 [Geobacteraceae bacterium]|nr:hypothetical protein [Geobacteraceae bacterium]
MRYLERLPAVSPGTLVATSQGVAMYVASGSLVGQVKISRSLERFMRIPDGREFVELSEEQMK